MEPSLPVLSRIDRLDRLLELLEEKHGKPRMFGSTTMTNDAGDHNEKIVDHPNCKTLSSALNDVHYKGTLIDRLAVLEDRVLQLSFDMEEGSTSRSSSSTAGYARKEEKDVPNDCSRQLNGKGKRRAHFKWMGWFAMRC